GNHVVESQLAELEITVHQGERQRGKAAEKEGQGCGDSDRRHSGITVEGCDSRSQSRKHCRAAEAHEGAYPEDLVELPFGNLLALDDGLLEAEILKQADERRDRADGGHETEIFRDEQAREHDDGEKLDHHPDDLSCCREHATTQGYAAE